MRLWLALVVTCCSCQAIDDFGLFRVVGPDGGAEAGANTAADGSGIPDGGSSQDMGTTPGDMQPCIIGQSLIGGCYLTK